MSVYKHKVHYYETDKMGITHHSNYIRWMEEARVDYLEEKELGPDRLEAFGYASPVVSVECHYKAATTFPEIVEISVSMVKFNGVRMSLKYEMLKADGSLAATASSEHCFIDGKGRPVSLKKACPKMYEGLLTLLEK
ncbi:MAG: acyl-CoA thioesterase [Oscillospiraceae bacterium]|nr:acyl-CoA thioesterase [Oscillospiraceae bacterium]